MDSGGNMRSNEEKGAEKHMDDYLKSIGLQRKKIAKDGSCLFRAVAEQVLHCQSLHLQVRYKCVEFLRKNRQSYEAFIEGDFEEYLHKLRDPQQWVGEVEINALAIMYQRDFWIFQDPGKAAVNITANNFEDKVQLCFLNGNHYDSVYPLSRIRNSAVCQSILYELLYDKVFAVDHNLLGVCQRSAKSSDLLIDDVMAACPSSEESDNEADALRPENETCASIVKSKGRGRSRQLSERVKRSLNPTLLRNVQYDVWHRSKKAQQKMDFCIASGMQYNVGDRCQVRVEASGEVVSAMVKILSPDSNGPVTVFNDDFGEIKVPVWKLRPPTDTTWSTVVRDKKVNNGPGEWEHRGRSRGRSSTAPPSVPQTTAPPAGRGAKPQSWPQPLPAEEREPTNTKSEPLWFGLTSKQRMAKEEEEKSAALVELQFPDDRSFPALSAQTGAQSEGVKKKGVDKRRSQKNTTRKSPVEEAVPVLSSTGEAPKSTSLPPSSPSPPVSAASQPNASRPSTSAPLPLAPKTSPPSLVPLSASSFSFVTPVLPAASNSSSSSYLPLGPKSSSPPTFIAPIAPSPTQGLITRTTPSPPASAPTLTHNPPPAKDVPASTLTSHSQTLLSEAPEPPNLIQTPQHIPVQVPAQVPVQVPAQTPFQVPVQVPIQIPVQVPVQSPVKVPAQPPVQTREQIPVQVPIQTTIQNRDLIHAPPRQVLPMIPNHQTLPIQSSPPSHPVPFQAPASYPSSLPPHEGNFSHLPPASPLASQTHTEPLKSGSPPDHAPPPVQHQYLPHVSPMQHQLAQIYQDPLYPGFPKGDEGQIMPTPPMSTSQSGDDLPRDTNVLRFFFNLGIQAYTLPMHAPVIYLMALQQAHTVQQSHALQQQSHSLQQSQALQQQSHSLQQSQALQQQSHSLQQSQALQQQSHSLQQSQALHQSHALQQSHPLQQSHSLPPGVPSRSPSPVCPPHEPYHTYNPARNARQPSYHPPENSTPPPAPVYNLETPHGPYNPTTFESNLHHGSYTAVYAPAPPPMQWQSMHANQAYPAANYPYNQPYYQNHAHHHNQGPVEQQQQQQQQPPANGDARLGMRLARLPGALDAESGGSMNGAHMTMQPAVTSFGHLNHEVRENMMLLVDPPLDKPIVINIPKCSSGPGSPALYSPSSHHSSDSSCAPFYMKAANHSMPPYHPSNHGSPYMPANHGAAFLQSESMSVSVGTADEDWNDQETQRVHFRGQRRGGRSRGRGQYRPRGYHTYSNGQQYSQRGGRGRS